MIARTEKPLSFRPRLVLVYADSARAALTSRQFRRQGWEVHLASCGREARRLAQILAPDVVLLDTNLRDESGWLTCAKLLSERPRQKVILVHDQPTPQDHRFAEFVGAAALVRHETGMALHVEGLLVAALATAG